MTLQEVMNQIPQKKWSTRVPSVSLMLEQDSPVFYDALDDETSAAIYSSGFVLFQKGDHATVFPLHDCKDYVYKTVEEEIVVPFSEFADQPWQIRICMEGKDRLVHNMNNRKTGRTVSIDAYDSDDLWDEFSDLGSGNPLNMLLERENNEEEIKTLTKNIAKLQEFQREVLILCVVLGNTQEQAAKILGTSHQAVSASLKRALHNLRMMYGISDNYGSFNRFSRKNK